MWMFIQVQERNFARCFLGKVVESLGMYMIQLYRNQNMSSLSFTSKPKKKDCPNTELGVLIHGILNLGSNFEFCSFNHVRRTENRVAHALANFRPYDSNARVWSLVERGSRSYL